MSGLSIRTGFHAALRHELQRGFAKGLCDALSVRGKLDRARTQPHLPADVSERDMAIGSIVKV
jgi:hypothetical protein